MKKNLIIGAISATFIILAMIGVFYAGKRTADREAREHELRVQLQTLKTENLALKNERKEIKQDTTGKLEATRSSRAQIESNEARIQDVEANVGIHILPSEQSVVKGSAPDAPSFVLQQSELPLLTGYITDFKINKTLLDGCTRELGVCDKQVKNLESQNSNRDEQLKIANRSGFWRKTGACALKVLVPAGIGYGFGGRTGAIAGAGAGGATCFVL